MENGFTLKEALIEAGITDDAYRRFLDKSADFRGQIEAAKMKLVMLSRSELAKAIREGDMTTVRWFLERKLSEEFGRHNEQEDVWRKNITVILPGSKPHPRIIPETDEEE